MKVFGKCMIPQLKLWQKIGIFLVSGLVFIFILAYVNKRDAELEKLKQDIPRKHALKSHGPNGRFEGFEAMYFHRCGLSPIEMSKQSDNEQTVRMEKAARKRFEELENASPDGVVMISDPALTKALSRAIPMNGKDKALYFTVFAVGSSSQLVWNWRQWIIRSNIENYVIVIRQHISGQESKEEMMENMSEGYPGWKKEFENGWPDYFYLSDELYKDWELCRWRDDSEGVRRGDTTSLVKTQFVTQSVLRGISVFYLDVDAILFRPFPAAQLMEEKGIAMSTYDPERIKPQHICRNIDGCFGQFFMYGGEAQASMMTQMVKEMVTDRGCEKDWFCDDQLHFTQMIRANMKKILTSVKYLNMEDCFGCNTTNTRSCVNWRVLDSFEYMSAASLQKAYMLLDKDFNNIYKPKTLHMTAFFTNTFMNRVMLLRELGIFIDIESYYTDRKYLQMSEVPMNASDIDHLTSLKVSIALAKATGRCLIVPKLPCRMSVLKTVRNRGGFYMPGEWCEILYTYNMKTFTEGICIRESSFLSKRYGYHVSMSPCKNCDKAPDAAQVNYLPKSFRVFSELYEEIGRQNDANVIRICSNPSEMDDIWASLGNTLRISVSNTLQKDSDVYSAYLRTNNRFHSGW
eukprot:CAMPEP_0167765292 /NCGR_PEP_ID=MMETSP0110_2-20121227/14589_1 /TAXON_ID=629695 /ORGANISM="Gymnochlora sp., Strain CCMP2014" /LENGTH=630 /DNA_ID=CAMNT_0007652955 /DNA_START=62 /DNA_END=1951 /DNA_ORIENTATION=+